MPKIFVALHADGTLPTLPYLTGLHVGAADSTIVIPNAVRDDQGDNISARNKNFAELTGLYWIWRNAPDDIVGLCHYRRYFSPFVLPGAPRVDGSVELMHILLSQDEWGRIFDIEMNFADLIVPTPFVFTTPLEQQYLAHHKQPEDWHAMIAALHAVHPEEAEAAHEFFRTKKEFTPYNMFIGKRAIVNSYCEWLFPILNEVERRIVPSEDSYEQRVFGFLAERLFSWWLHHHKPNLIRRQVLQIKDYERAAA